MRKHLLAIFCFLIYNVDAYASHSMIEWGINKTIQPYGVGANINGNVSDFANVSSTGVWTLIPSYINVTNTSNVVTTKNEKVVIRDGTNTSLAIYNSHVPPGWYVQDTLSSTLTLGPGSSVQNANAISTYVRNLTPAAYGVSCPGGVVGQNCNNAVGYFSVGEAGVDGANTWAFNPTLTDNIANTQVTTDTIGRVIVGSEYDISVYANKTTVQGMAFILQGPGTPVGANAVQISAASGVGNNAEWTNAFVVNNGAATNAAIIGTNSKTQAANTASMPILFGLYDSANVGHYLQIKAIPFGTDSAIQFSDQSRANGVAISNSATGNTPAIFSAGSDTNINLILAAKGTGQIIFNNPTTIPFTQSGTGAVATTVDAFLKKYYTFTGYSTYANAITAAGGGAINVPFGTYNLSTGLTFGNQTQLTGDIGGYSTFTYSGTTGPLFTLFGNGSSIKNMMITQSGSPSLTTGIVINNGSALAQQNIIKDVRLTGPFTTGIDGWSGVARHLNNVIVSTSGSTGIIWRNPGNPDAGDDSWQSVLVSGPIGDLVNYQSGGGLKVSGFKGLGGTNGFHMALPDGSITQDLLFTGSSIENSSANCMLFERTGTTGLFGNINIVGNEFAGCPSGVTFNNAGVGNAIVDSNTFSSISGSAIIINPGAFNVNVGLNSYSTNTPITDNRNLAYTDEDGIILWKFKRGFINVTTSTRNLYRIDLPLYRGAECTVIMEGIVQGAGSFLTHQTFSLLSSGAGANLTYNSIANMTYSAGQVVDWKTDTTTTAGSIYVGLAQHSGIGTSVAGTMEIECRGKIKKIVYQ